MPIPKFTDEKLQAIQVLIDSLTPNIPSPGNLNMIRLSSKEKHELILCVYTKKKKEITERDKTKFQNFVYQKGHEKDDKLIRKIPEESLYLQGKEVIYVYFHKVEILEGICGTEEAVLK